MEAIHPTDLSEYCEKYEQWMSLLGKRWTGLILRALLSGATRFSEICAYVPGLRDRLLAQRLKEIEAEGSSLISSLASPARRSRRTLGVCQLH